MIIYRVYEKSSSKNNDITAGLLLVVQHKRLQFRDYLLTRYKDTKLLCCMRKTFFTDESWFYKTRFTKHANKDNLHLYVGSSHPEKPVTS
jgi:hypothetical protein